MRLQELLLMLVKLPALDRKQMKLVKTTLLTGVKNFNSLGYIEKEFFKESYDASLRLIVTRLRDGLDRDPCSGLSLLVTKAPYYDIQDAGRFRWIDENIPVEICNLYHLDPVLAGELNLDPTSKETLVNDTKVKLALWTIKVSAMAGAFACTRK